MFGLNPFGGPNYKFVWGASEFIRMGNAWTRRDRFGIEHTVVGYREKYLCHGMPCWNLLRWKSGLQYGTPELWYLNTFDKATGLFMLGEYPWKGRYEILQPFYSREFRNGKLVIEHMPLSHILIDKIIPIIEHARKMTTEEQRAAVVLARQKEHERDVAITEDIMKDNMPAYFEPVSFTNQGIRTALVTRKMDAIQKKWNQLTKRVGHRPTFRNSRGFFRGNAPIPN
jgi:hypothetical protein